MGRQKGPLKVKGTLGDITFAKGRNGYVVKEKSEISPEMRANSKEFAALRAQQAEFGRSGIACRLLRRAFQEQVDIAKDFRSSQRLQKRMMQVVYSDNVNRRGQRDVISGDLSMLEDFEFNVNADWMHSLNLTYASVIDRAAGAAGVSLPAFVPQQRITASHNSTHFRIVCAAAEIDFVNGSYDAVVTQSALIPIDFAVVPPMNLTNQLTPASTKTIFLVLGIQFSEVTNGFEDLIVNGKYNALTIIKVDRV